MVSRAGVVALVLRDRASGRPLAVVSSIPPQTPESHEEDWWSSSSELHGYLLGITTDVVRSRQHVRSLTTGLVSASRQDITDLPCRRLHPRGRVSHRSILGTSADIRSWQHAPCRSPAARLHARSSNSTSTQNPRGRPGTRPESPRVGDPIRRCEWETGGRDWMDITRESFYDPNRLGDLADGLRLPRHRPVGRLPPRPECAARCGADKVLEQLGDVQLTLVIGQYAQRFPPARCRSVSDRDRPRAWKDRWPFLVAPLPHPSPRNNIWLKKNEWFEEELVPEFAVESCDHSLGRSLLGDRHRRTIQ